MQYSTASRRNIANQTSFFQARSKLTIASIDRHTMRVEAQYNPKELSLTQPIKWDTATPASHQDLEVTFGGVQPQTMQVELLFDGFEDQTSVQPKIDQLKELAAVRVPGSTNEDHARPHVCLVVWGHDGLPRMSCVIEQIVTKYLVFGTTGAALRATCTVSLKETRAVGAKRVSQDFGWYSETEHVDQNH